MIEIIITLFALLLAAAIGMALVLAYIVCRMIPKVEKESETPPPVKEKTPEELRKARRLQKEVENMLSYNGEPQEEITVD
jgi:hypothetical protein